ncbi:hydroxymethylpyrimidine/phosphomethylpyrimidine kinase [Flavobacterium amniphilum]|uniref:hydroxymethylpyrimidine/phosphomethylpyrimidine kinase n=1 Tax=Flavobacterium amniphilum TaxID=1834035 RepID=UPI002029EFEA|nr:hydroxymethylpyrimidine/phosphomethylpyrimidine kinase [Flavobacterium amniphilum]MCL9804164.1 hydroxymethylpyrimidine/phosphomethylpyrimidine kinase [Flavobacterium amniphilum]
MSANRPFVLSIAGFDPSGGAGILADIKTFEQHRVYGLGILTGNTIQTEDAFYSIQWTDLDFVLHSIDKLFGTYTIKAVKIGIVPSLDYLKYIIKQVRNHSAEVKIVWDTVLKSTTEFEFATVENQSVLIDILKETTLITPNYDEIRQLNPNHSSIEEMTTELSKYSAILLKGGHHPTEKGTDYLYSGNKTTTLKPTVSFIEQKHGSGCVLSSAIASNLALGLSIEKACQQSKQYIENYLNTNNTLLGYHHA